MEVRSPLKGQGPPRLRCIGRLDEPQLWRQVFAQVGVPTGDEVPGTDDGERHGVLPPVRDPLEPAVVLATEHAHVGGDVQRPVGRVGPESVDMAEQLVLIVTAGGLRGFARATNEDDSRDQTGGDAEGAALQGVSSQS